MKSLLLRYWKKIIKL